MSQINWLMQHFSILFFFSIFVSYLIRDVCIYVLVRDWQLQLLSFACVDFKNAFLCVFSVSITSNKGKERWVRRKEKSYISWFKRVKTSRVSPVFSVFSTLSCVFISSLSDHKVVYVLFFWVITHCMFYWKRGEFPAVLWGILRFQGNLHSYQTKVKQTSLF